MRRSRALLSIYARIWRTYRRWAPSLLLLAVVVFVPLGAIHALTLEANVGSLDLGGGLHLLAILGAVLALAATGLVGEVFYTGAVSILLTHPHDEQAPSLREIAAMVKYGPLIAIDLLYGFGVAVGLILFFFPGVLVFVWFGLTAPVVEIEHRGVRAAFRRSIELVRHKFWVVALVLIPIEIAGDALTNLATAGHPRHRRQRIHLRVARRRALQHRLHPVLRGGGRAAHGRPDPRKGRRGRAAPKAGLLRPVT